MPGNVVAKPLYIQLRESLATRIASGEWKWGQALPNEIEIAEAYGMSPGTARKALDLMEAERLVVRQQGRGTFVRECTAEDIAQRYLRLRSADGRTVLGAPIKGLVGYGVATTQECERLRLQPGTEVRRTTRMRVLKGRPYAQELSVVPSALFRLPEAQQRADLSILELSRRCGVLILSGEERIKATNASRDLAASLGCPEGNALFEFDRVLLTLGGTPAVWDFGHWFLPGGYYLSRLGDIDCVSG